MSDAGGASRQSDRFHDPGRAPDSGRFHDPARLPDPAPAPARSDYPARLPAPAPALPLFPRDTGWFKRVFGFTESKHAGKRMRKKVKPRYFATASPILKSITPALDCVLEIRPGHKQAASPHPPLVFPVGPFECVSGQELHSRLRDSRPFDLVPSGIRFKHVWNTDVYRVLQNPKHADAVFQVASQTNCLEMVNPERQPEHGITGYVNDRTQGPVCAIACAPGTLFRNYFVKVSNPGSITSHIGQSAKHQLDTMREAQYYLQKLERKRKSRKPQLLKRLQQRPMWVTRNGYLMPVDDGSGGSSFMRLLHVIGPSVTPQSGESLPRTLPDSGGASDHVQRSRNAPTPKPVDVDSDGSEGILQAGAPVMVFPDTQYDQATGRHAKVIQSRETTGGCLFYTVEYDDSGEQEVQHSKFVVSVVFSDDEEEHSSSTEEQGGAEYSSSSDAEEFQVAKGDTVVVCRESDGQSDFVECIVLESPDDTMPDPATGKSVVTVLVKKTGDVERVPLSALSTAAEIREEVEKVRSATAPTNNAPPSASSPREQCVRKIKVGVQWNTPVVRCDVPVGMSQTHCVCQVYCSALPLAYMSPEHLVPGTDLAQMMLEAVYFNTLAAAALLARARKQRIDVFLTAVGGGAFGNSAKWIISAIAKALHNFKNEPLNVVLVHYGAPEHPWAEELPEISVAS